MPEPRRSADVREWTLSRVVTRNGQPITGWQIGLPDEYSENHLLEVVQAQEVRVAASDEKEQGA